MTHVSQSLTFGRVKVGGSAVDRCMFERNFQVDRVGCDYVALWNAFKRLASACSPAEKAALFSGTAARTYQLRIDASA